jgi:uncharacterized protein YidB (DUF937 family)
VDQIDPTSEIRECGGGDHTVSWVTGLAAQDVDGADEVGYALGQELDDEMLKGQGRIFVSFLHPL